MSLGSGFAVLGIWGTVAFSILHLGVASLAMAFMAMLATGFIVENQSSSSSESEIS